MRAIGFALLLMFSSAFAAPRVEEGRFKTPDGVELFYQKVGDGKQFVIIPGGLFSFDGLKPLANKDRTVIFYDMRNRGRSQHIGDMPKITIEADVADLEAVRAHFKAPKFTPVGYSYLGMMVMLYAKDHPDRVDRVVQLGPVPLKFPTEYPPEFDNTRDRSVVDGAKYAQLQEFEKQGMKEKDPRKFCEKQWEVLRVRLVANPPKNVDRLTNTCAYPNEWPVNFERHLHAHFEGSVQKMNVSKQDIAAKVTMPVLTIHGKKDRNAPYGAGREWARSLPDARLITLENAAHNSWADEPELIVRAIDTFLTGKWPTEAEKISAANRTDVEQKLALLTFAPAFVEMQGGTFTLGDANGAAAERPTRTVQLSPFWISTTEITRQHFEVFVSDTGYKTEPEQPENSGGWVRPPGEKEMVRKSDANWRNPYFETEASQPITFVTSIDAIAYADWLASKTGLAIKLPTEAQWEFACKQSAQQAVFTDASSVVKPQPAQSTTQLTNMRGNVWEWTRDFYSDYSAASATGPEQPKDLGRGRVIRGGSYAFPASMATCTYRTEGHSPHARAQDLGFRLVIESSK